MLYNFKSTFDFMQFWYMVTQCSHFSVFLHVLDITFQVGLIDRHRILSLFEQFYDSAQESVKETLRNPRKCKLSIVSV